MKGLIEDPRTDLERKLSSYTSQQVIEDLYQPLPIMATPALGGGAVTDTAYDVAAIEFPNGVTSQAKLNYRVFPRWVRGGAFLRILYSSPVANVAAFNFSTILRFFAPGDDLTGGTATALSVTHSLPGPAAADKLLTFDYVSSAPLFRVDKPYCCWVLVRLDPDANPNALKIVSFEWKVLGV
jgi:hypothetical protein